MTEYESLDENLAVSVLRLGWLDKDAGEPRPRRWSEQVTWAVEDFERQRGVPDEELDPAARDEA
jgi:hypothetical protein